ncbi:MAG TPA: hypothetical protein VME42_03840 [Steroidobacteraceae bacterium]|nr:hypothetical protein [Steroidobacteraceae bacterium]
MAKADMAKLLLQQEELERAMNPDAPDLSAPEGAPERSHREGFPNVMWEAFAAAVRRRRRAADTR